MVIEGVRERAPQRWAGRPGKAQSVSVHPSQCNPNTRFRVCGRFYRARVTESVSTVVLNPEALTLLLTSAPL